MAKVHNPRNLNRKLSSDVLAKNANEYATNSYAFIFLSCLAYKLRLIYLTNVSRLLLTY